MFCRLVILINTVCVRVCARARLPADSESTTVTLTALLASLNSCCNPWIYMVFSGHLLSDLPCCRRLAGTMRLQDSDSSLRRSTLLSRLQAPRLSDPPPGNSTHIPLAS